jgi:NADPH-dependent 2,4-dienoyl-CoA reductase/sulfur reductase-like enzyme
LPIEFLREGPIVRKKKYMYQEQVISIPDGWHIAVEWTANGFRPAVYGWNEVTIKLRREIPYEEQGQERRRTPTEEINF